MPRGKTDADDPFENDDWGPPSGEETGSGSSGEEMPDAATEERPQFLKPHHLRQKEGKMELVSVGGSTEYSDVVLFVKVQNRTWRIGLKNFDPGYKSLRAKFGSKRQDWHGEIRYKVMPHGGKREGFVAIRA